MIVSAPGFLFLFESFDADPFEAGLGYDPYPLELPFRNLFIMGPSMGNETQRTPRLVSVADKKSTQTIVPVRLVSSRCVRVIIRPVATATASKLMVKRNVRDNFIFRFVFSFQIVGRGSRQIIMSLMMLKQPMEIKA